MFQYYGVSIFYWAIVIGINLVNFFLKVILKIIVKFERRHDKTEEVVSTTLVLFVVTFINTAIILLIVNINLDLGLPDYFPIFAGDYDEFTVEWYRTIGSSIVVTMIIGIFSPHINNSISWILNALKRWFDRGFSLDYSKTKQLFQIDYESKYIGATFNMEYRYS